LARRSWKAAAHHQSQLETLTRDVESTYVAARVKLASALVDYHSREGRSPDLARLLAIADELGGVGARLAQAQALRHATWAAAHLGRTEDYIALARRASAIIDAIAAELPARERDLFLMNKWSGRDELVSALLRELGAEPSRRAVLRFFQKVEL